jgi:hypothetical protein
MHKFIQILLFLFLSQAIFAQSDDGPLENIDIYLHTVDVGNLVYNNFGHTAVRVNNKNLGTDHVYNWGIFDFNDPVDFSINFYKGILLYKLGVFENANVKVSYALEKRTVWEDKLNLTPPQKRILLDRLKWNFHPDNIEYQYHYFFNNCSTKVRDYFDEALSGKLKAQFESKTAGRKFRNAVQKGYATNPEIQLSLDIIMNNNIDAEMNQWQEMFLPIKLREALLSYNTENKLITETTILVEEPTIKAYSLSSFQMLALTLLILFAGIYYGQNRKSGFMLERLLFIPCFFILLTLGIFGFIMPLNWIFSDHIDLHHNANMLLLWPIDLFLLFPLFRIIKSGRNLSVDNRIKGQWDKYIFAHLIMNVLFFLMWVVGVFDQDVSNSALYIMPCLSILLILIRRSYTSSTQVVNLSGSSIIN